MEGEIDALPAVIDSMPHERIEASPELALAFGAALLARGDHAGAAPYVRMACNHAKHVPTQRRAQFTASLVAVRLHESLRGADPKGALEAARELLGHDAVLESEGVDCALRAFVLSQLGIVELWTGELDAATEHLECAMATSLAAGTDWTTLTASAHLAALAIEQGRHEDAATVLDGAADALRDARHPPLRAVHALLRALLVADAEEPEAALSLIQAARADLGDWPLPPQLEKQLVAHEALLRAAVLEREAGRQMVGRQARRPAVMTAERLSEREQVILRYLPTMMSNQEIAGELYVSINTVKTHLKSIYRKLDATGRRDAVLRGRDLGLMP
jgi:LuxR family transcriptional regulator, maltose regulon positive regulatory protein